MKKIDWYVFRQLFGATLFVTVTLTGVVWLMQSLRFVEMIVNRGLSVPLFVYFTFLLLPTFISVILPVALLGAVIFIYNRLLSDSELVVMRAGGYSQFALAKPAILLSLLTMIIGYSLTIYLIPASYRDFKDLQFTLRNSYPTVLLQEGVFNQVADGLTVYVRKRHDGGDLSGIIIHDDRENKIAVTMMAEKGAIVPGEKGPRVILLNGNRQQVNDKTGQLSLLHFNRYSFDLNTVKETPAIRWREPRERFLDELFYPMSQAKTLWNFQKLRMEGHHRLSAPLLPLCFTFLALAFMLSGDFNRRGQLWKILATVGIAIVVQIAHLGVKNLGEKIPDVVPLMYLVPLLPILIALYIFSPLNKRSRRQSSNAVPDGASN